jgi:hypothetical protein
MSFAFNFSFGVGMGSNGVGQAPINDIAPVVSGLLTTGSTLSCTTGTWSVAPTITYAYQWRRGGVDIVGATSSTYVLVVADMYNNIDCLVTATNAFGSGQAPSNSVFASEEFSDVFGANYLFDWNPDVSASLSTSSGAVNSIASVGLNTAAFTQTGAARPQLVANQINGKPVIRFDGATSFMAIASSTALFNFLHNATGGTVIIVLKAAGAGTGRRVMGNRSGNAVGLDINSGSEVTITNMNTIFIRTYNTSPTGIVMFTLTANNTITGDFQSAVNIFDTSNATLDQRGTIILDNGAAVNNNTASATLSDTNAGFDFTLGRRVRLNDVYYNGDIARIIIVNAKATPTQQAQVAARLAFEYGTFPI